MEHLGNIDEEGETDNRVCHACIADSQLNAEIRRHGRPEPCSYCDNTRLRTVSIPQLARRIDPVYLLMVGFGEQEPDFEPDSDNVHWIIRGDTPSELIGEMIECADTTIAEEIVSQLGSDHSWTIGMGEDQDWYDDSSDTFVLETPDDPEFRMAWESFCQSIKHERRFFGDEAIALLDKILGPILDGRQKLFRNVVRTIGPEDEERFIYRGRIANEESARARIYGAPIAELASPPTALATAGRMNSAGISVFYGSADAETAVAELRVPVGGIAVVGRFEIIRPLRLLDLTRLEVINNDLSLFHPDYFTMHSYASLLRGFHQEIRKPVIPGRETLEYLPTQVVAEYLWTRGERSVDGLIFGSSQVSGDRTNIVLFPRASHVEGAEAETRREVAGIYHFGGDEDEPPDVAETVYLHPAPNPVPAPNEDRTGLGDDWFEPVDAVRQPVLESSLRLDLASLTKVFVRAIRYSVAEMPVQLEDERQLPF